MKSTSTSLNWPGVLAALRSCTAQSVLIRDGKSSAPAELVRSRPAASGTELSLFSGESGATRVALVEQLEALAKSAGRRFMKPARANIDDANLLVASVADETVDGTLVTIVETHRVVVGHSPGLQRGDSTTFRNKRIKQW